MKILVINGVNLNMLGVREPKIYGTETLQQIYDKIIGHCKAKNIEVDFFQSNIEGEICEAFHKARGIYDGIIINPGAFTHYSYAIRDAIPIAEIPTIEVHMSNVYTRDDFRHNSVTAPVCIGQIAGFGSFGYIMAVDALENYKK